MKNKLDMIPYKGADQVLAVPMKLGEYNEYRGWVMPEDENPTADGFMIEYPPGDQAPNHKLHMGYITWRPKDIFNACYSLPKTFKESLESIVTDITVRVCVLYIQTSNWVTSKFKTSTK